MQTLMAGGYPHILRRFEKIAGGRALAWSFGHQQFRPSTSLRALRLRRRQTPGTHSRSSVRAIDESLSPFEELRGRVNRAEPNIDPVRLRRYIAAFERVGNVLKYKGITLEIADGYYGSRFANLIRYPPARGIVGNGREGWEDFYYLWEKLRGYNGNRRELPEPPAK